MNLTQGNGFKWQIYIFEIRTIYKINRNGYARHEIRRHVDKLHWFGSGDIGGIQCKNFPLFFQSQIWDCRIFFLLFIERFHLRWWLLNSEIYLNGTFEIFLCQSIPFTFQKYYECETMHSHCHWCNKKS